MRNYGYVKKKLKFGWIVVKVYKKYLNFVNMMLNCYEVYNEIFYYIEKEE